MSHPYGTMRTAGEMALTNGGRVGLQVWRSERADGLLGPLAELLSQPPADPFTREVVSVPTAGIERWLAQELALRLGAAEPAATDGVCANVEFPFPGKIIGTALEAAGGVAGDHDVWRPDRLVWPLLELYAAEPAAAWWGPAASHLASTDDGRRFSAARVLVDLFDRYAVHRPEMVLAWHANAGAGDDPNGTAPDVGPDLQPIAASHAWQPQLWRRLRATVGTASTAERFGTAAETIAAGGIELDLPERLSVFGLTALPESYLRVLAALAAERDVHLFLLHPSPVLWGRVNELADERPLARCPRDDDPSADLPRNPLLGSWGRDAREMQVVFAGVGARDAAHRRLDTDGPTSLLSRLQDDVRADRRPPGAPVAGADDLRSVLDPDDRSVQVHACHGRMRQVQVLRDAVLHLLAADHSLEPRDVIVMCPDVETFAPLVDAVFGAQVESDDAGGTPSLRVRLADRSIRQTNPVLKVVAELLELADSRITGSEVLDLLGREPVRRRFRFSDDDLERLEAWIPELGVRWGLDGDDRERFDLAGLDMNTWRRGIDRLLAGVAIADEGLRLIGDTVPFDDVEGSDVDLAGRFAECVGRLAAACRGLRDPRGMAAWRDAIRDVAVQLTAVPESEAWKTQQLERVLDEFVEHARAAEDGTGTASTELTLAELRVLLADRLRGRPTRANHRTGDLTVSTLVPMRAVPHRVVCLLGMDDGSFPRRTAGDGDDLIDLVPFVGDRDPRTEDRQLLLDALMAATEHLVVTYSGRDERTNEPLPPAVPIGELLDVVDATVRFAPDVEPATPDATATEPSPTAAPARTAIVVEHPLQPFSPRNYADGELVRGRRWSFDTVALDGARARRQADPEPRPFLSEPLELRPEDLEVVDVGALIRFLDHPSKAFLSERLGVRFPSRDEGLDDGLPLEMGGLPRWNVGDRLLNARLQGISAERWERVERARGTLPPDPLCDEIIEDVSAVTARLVEAAEGTIGTGEPRAIELDHPLPDGRRLVGTITGVVDDTVGTVTFSRLKSKLRLAAYVELLALSVADPSRPWRGAVVAQKKAKDPVETYVLGPLGTDAASRRREAEERLAILVDLYERGMRAPAPLFGDASEEIARNDADPKKTAWFASRSWESGVHAAAKKDDIDPCNVAVLGRVAAFSELMEMKFSEEDPRPEDWHECEEVVVSWARRLWDPVRELEAETARKAEQEASA
jgi:exodeoxyribonuclease V gamma subunit